MYIYTNFVGDRIMRKINFLSIVSFILAIIGFVFSLLFQSLAYWGPDGTFISYWYWVGAILAYVCSFSAIILMILNSIKRVSLSGLDEFFRLITVILFLSSILWTTFIIIARQSGM